VTITGTDLTGATVSFGGPAGTITADTGTQLTVTSPPGSAGPVNVTVTTAGGTSNAESFTYVVPLPALTGISPASGSTGGGTSVTLTGTDLTGATVSFGSTTVTPTGDTGTQLTLTSPAGSAGTVNVTVTTPGGTSNAESFTYVPPPTISALSPSCGDPADNTPVTITGTNLAGATVDFGGTAVTPATDTGTQLTLTSPTGSANTSVQVTVTTVGGTSGALEFAYSCPTPPPT
jgi:IPT/TIG domain